MGPAVRQSIPNEDLFHSAVKNHEDVFDALLARDPKAATAAMSRDVMEGYPF